MKPMLLTADPQERKDMPITTGVIDYFPLAVAMVAQVSKAGNEQHNPGKPLHWDKTKSLDHADCIARHLIDRGSLDTDGIRHSAKLAWRALALLQTELEQEQHNDEQENKNHSDWHGLAAEDLETNFGGIDISKYSAPTAGDAGWPTARREPALTTGDRRQRSRLD